MSLAKANWSLNKLTLEERMAAPQCPKPPRRAPLSTISAWKSLFGHGDRERRLARFVEEAMVATKLAVNMIPPEAMAAFERTLIEVYRGEDDDTASLISSLETIYPNPRFQAEMDLHDHAMKEYEEQLANYAKDVEAYAESCLEARDTNKEIAERKELARLQAKYSYGGSASRPRDK